MATSLLIGGSEDRESAKRRRKAEYAQDLELQMREKEAARQRERIQGMAVNASGWLDPEKGPERFKPLGGVHWTEERGRRVDRVKPYHTLFLYGSDGATPRTYATAGVVPPQPVDQAYNVTYNYQPPPPQYSGSIVQPISMPAARPVILTNTSTVPVYDPGPRYIPVPQRDDGTARELRNLLNLTQAEKDRLRRENEEFQRRLRRELDDEKRKLLDQEAEARRRMEELRREAEARRREADRERAEAERLRRLKQTVPDDRPVTTIVRPASKTHVYYDMNDYRQRLQEERRKIEELLKAGKPVKEVWDLKVVPRQRIQLPPTPSSADRANRDRVREFNDLKYRDFNARDQFRTVYPDVPVTNRRLEEQQEALLRQQEENLRDVAIKTSRKGGMSTRRAVSRPSWMDRPLTPFNHVLRKRDRMYTTVSADYDRDLDLIERRAEDRSRYLGNLSYRSDDIGLDSLRLRKHRSNSADTLEDDTWLRPSSTAEV